MQQELLRWISQQQDTLDQIIAKTADAYLEDNKNRRSNFIFDIQEANQEKYALSQGKDLCYDRPSIGFVYSLWYHGRRINTFLTYLISVFYRNQEKEVEIFDLGAGTGAVQWAIGVIYAGMKALKIATPKLKIINIDNSPFMLKYHQLLWKEFVNHYSECSDISWEYKINSWNNSETSACKNYWLCASYLFDSNDHEDLIIEDFIKLINNFKPVNIILLTSNQEHKRIVLNKISSKINILGYETDETFLREILFNGVMLTTSQRREQYQKELDIKGLTGEAKWNDFSFTGKIFRQTALINAQKIQSIDIYTPPIKQRKQVELSESQRKAARHSDRPTIITGPAGSGKSIVITERIKNLVEENDYNPSLNILLTTFNKGLLLQLGDWLEELLDSDKFIRKINANSQGEIEDTSKFYFGSSDSANITLMHFDILPTRIGKIKAKTPHDKYSIEMINKIIHEVKEIYKTEDKEVLNPDFILEEFHRVFYGLGYRNKGTYLVGKRRGRGKALMQKRREIIWDCLEQYYNTLEKHNIHEFTRMRIKFLDALKNNIIKEKFTHIFVDEFQDCTKADFQIFYHLVQNTNHLVIAGDSAQAIHLGTSYGIPPKQDGMAIRRIIRLESSYRLPYRISECIRELPRLIIFKHKKNKQDITISPNEISPYKGSPPGARPIVVFAKTLDAISKKIKEIFEIYSEAYGLNKITILDKDQKLCFALIKLKINAETDTILRIKGLEKECVLWSVRSMLGNDKEAEEMAYTILTRTSSILIIALSEQITSVCKTIIGTFDRSKLIFWDEETKNKYSAFCQETESVISDSI